VRRVYAADWVLPVEGPPIADGAVEVEDGRIVAVGAASELGADERFEGAAIVPGFVNAHSHLEYAVYAGFGDGLDFAPWILLHIERKGRLELGDMRAIALRGAADCLRSGITTVGDASYMGAAAEACAELGLRAVVYLEVFGNGTEQLTTRYEANRARVQHVLSDRVRIGISPHSAYSVSLELWEAAAELGLPMMTHFLESQAEADWIKGKRGGFPVPPNLEPSSIQRLAAAGVLSERVTAAHLVKADADDIAVLAAHEVAVVHCPRSNALLGCGIAPLRELRAAGVRVGLGTDSPASTPSFDMFEEMRAAVAGARAREESAAALSAAEALELATLGSARALGLDRGIGSLAPGKWADLAVLSLEGSPYLPWEDPAAAVVYGGAPERVLLTVVDGEPRYRKGDTEWHGLIAAASRARARMLASSASTRAPT
jgi:cytosine/adenosine deaminase-related metal-dependent hydrolase